MIQFTTADTEYNITGLSIGTSYMISVVPSVGMCQGEGKELMVDTSTSIPTCKLSVYSHTLVTYRFLLLNSSPLQLPFAIEFVTFTVEFITFAIAFATLATDSTCLQ